MRRGGETLEVAGLTYVVSWWCRRSPLSGDRLAHSPSTRAIIPLWALARQDWAADLDPRQGDRREPAAPFMGAVGPARRPWALNKRDGLGLT
jgi:hypothetical protein